MEQRGEELLFGGSDPGRGAPPTNSHSRSFVARSLGARSLGENLIGLVDRFAWPLRTSHYLELANPRWTTHTLQARVEKVWDETSDTRTLTLRPGRGWHRHRAGQYVRVGVTAGGTCHVRTYSISSAPESEDEGITITVKAIAGGRVSNHLVRSLQPGSYLQLALPQGDFVLPEATPVKPLFITAGSGITPIMSMLRSFAIRGEMPDIVHLHFARRPRDVVFGNELKRLSKSHPRYRLQFAYTHDRDRHSSDERHLSARLLEQLCPDWKARECYACGPESLLDTLDTHWTNSGLARHLHVERFRAPMVDLPANAKGGPVNFSVTGLEIEADGRTNLLTVAENMGLNPPHGCRMGICHGCDTTLVSGRVRDLRNNKLIEEPGSTVQICVCAAAGPVELEL